MRVDRVGGTSAIASRFSRDFLAPRVRALPPAPPLIRQHPRPLNLTAASNSPPSTYRVGIIRCRADVIAHAPPSAGHDDDDDYGIKKNPTETPRRANTRAHTHRRRFGSSAATVAMLLQCAREISRRRRRLRLPPPSLFRPPPRQDRATDAQYPSSCFPTIDGTPKRTSAAGFSALTTETPTSLL